jgi:bis(5'-nucleosyl)-tetraphosphatase (symmetrical)
VTIGREDKDMATYAIGDVQGCFETLCALLDTIAFDRTRDRLWFAGDLVNRGPRSLDVLRFVKALGDCALTVLGNHDLNLLAVAHGLKKSKPQDTLTEVFAACDREALLTWLRHRSFFHFDPALGIAMVHAGLPPQWTLEMAQDYAANLETALQGPDYRHLLKRISGHTAVDWRQADDEWTQHAYCLQCFTHLRFCDAQGRLELKTKGPPGTQPEPYQPWFDLPGRRTANHTIVFGHWASLGPCTAPGVYALDTGCVWGGSLTALCLETREQFSVASREGAPRA